MITVHRLTPAIGIELRGVDLNAGSSVFKELREMLLEHGVVVMRGQDMTRSQQVEVAQRFGSPDRLPGGQAEQPEVIRIEHGPDSPPTENIWHADLSFLPEPPLGTVLRAIEVPDAGGDTLFADMRDVWRALPDRIRQSIQPLHAEHDIAKWAPDRAEQLHAAAPPYVHPLVRVHPETGEEILFVNAAYTTRIVELVPEDSIQMLNFLLSQISVPERQCRVHWEPGTVVIWDNRSVVHYATADYMPHRRVMERITISSPAHAASAASETREAVAVA